MQSANRAYYGITVVAYMYRKSCRHANKLINSSRSDHTRRRLSAASDCKTRWNIAKELLHSNNTRSNNLAISSMCTKFVDFFHSKIVSLKQAIAATAATLGRPLADPAYTGPELRLLPICSTTVSSQGNQFN